MDGADTEPEGRLSGEPVPISALQHAVYCMRQAALIHLERMWADNRFTAEGDVFHTASDRPGQRKVRGVRRVFALPVASHRLGIAGVADMVEFVVGEDGAETPFPVEYKRGKPKKHRADEVQLCAQALCLEEMTETPVPWGALFYGETKRRVDIRFDHDLRAVTETTVAELIDVIVSRTTPPPTTQKSRCRACSLRELCRPDTVSRSAIRWRSRALADLLAGEPSAPVG